MVSLTETQESILDAVQSVIVRDGVASASMRQVAATADVSLGLLSYHFDDKDSLIAAAFERATDALFDASVKAAQASDDPSERVTMFLRGSFTPKFLDGDYLRLRIALWTVAVTDPGLAKIDARFFDKYRRALVGLLGEALPELGSRELRDRVTDVISFSNGLWLDWARFGETDDLQRGLQRCEAIALTHT